MQFLFISSWFTLYASSPRSVALTQLRFTLLTVTSSQRDLHPQVCAHVGHTRYAPMLGASETKTPASSRRFALRRKRLNGEFYLAEVCALKRLSSSSEMMSSTRTTLVTPLTLRAISVARWASRLVTRPIR